MKTIKNLLQDIWYFSIMVAVALLFFAFACRNADGWNDNSLRLALISTAYLLGCIGGVKFYYNK